MFYFCGSIRGGLEDTEIYSLIIKAISEYGTCLTEHVGNSEYLSHETLTDQEIYAKDMSWLQESKAVIADVSIPSIGVGYELSRAEYLRKPVLVLYRRSSTHRISAMISGNEVEEALEYTREFLKSL